jgi:hypothetical protein
MRRRAPGAGRKLLNPEDRNSAALNIRVRPDVRWTLQQLAAKRKRKLSREIQKALDSWIERHHDRPPHIEELSLIAMSLGRQAENFTGKRWSDDPFTAQAIVAAFNQLMIFRDLGGVAKKPSNFEKSPVLKSNTPKAVGKLLALGLIMLIGAALTDPKELDRYPKSADPADDEAWAAYFEDYRRMFRRFGSGANKQTVAKWVQGGFK